MKLRFNQRSLFIFDAACGLAAGLIYWLFFDFMVQTLGLPVWLVKAQLVANLVYGTYGAILLLSRVSNLKYFKFLSEMNRAYGVLCLMIGLWLVLKSNLIGGALLLIESVFVGGLGSYEKQLLAKNPDHSLPES